MPRTWRIDDLAQFKPLGNSGRIRAPPVGSGRAPGRSEKPPGGSRARKSNFYIHAFIQNPAKKNRLPGGPGRLRKNLGILTARQHAPKQQGDVHVTMRKNTEHVNECCANCTTFGRRTNTYVMPAQIIYTPTTTLMACEHVRSLVHPSSFSITPKTSEPVLPCRANSWFKFSKHQHLEHLRCKHIDIPEHGQNIMQTCCRPTRPLLRSRGRPKHTPTQSKGRPKRTPCF
jgi:hypothetical protein